ncbi:hypothetical protein GCM10007385_32890 [Tateyamaria omphalii]|uniref:CopD family protein n=1 Tax=Tateyamaria omphalii TaxID=299262 RepID=UPI0016764F14|nr:CopD family protein [Tateyamaria omphalii]GGX61044.1 hypothetical protein GCM10007385_32890 [Tateyamaria omphalii]
MNYELIKAAHLIAVLTWLSSMAVVYCGIALARSDSLQGMKSFDSKVTTPAMILTWFLGLALAVQGGWLGNGWLWAKIAIVLCLSGFHGVVSGRLRRRTPDASVVHSGFPVRGLLIGWFSVATVVVLVVTKPL